MPARHRPGSEYKKKFRWHESVKSASFSPSREQSAVKAGLGSGDIAYVRSDVREPPLQRRRKPLEEQGTHTIKSSSINHVPLDRDNSGKARQTLASAKTYKLPQHKAADKSTDRPKHSSFTNGHSKSSDTADQQRVPKMGVTRVISAAPTKERHDSGGRSSDTNKNNNKTTRKSKTSPRVSDAKNGSSGDKVKNSIALQYQAGIHPNRPKGAKYLSEYQRQFEWKKPLAKESPLLAAEQMVYTSNTNITPFVPDKIPRHTEYQKQFKGWQPLHVQPPVQEQLMENAKREIKAKYMVKTKSKKSKKTNVTPDKMRAAGMPSALTSPEQVQNLKNSQNPQQPFFPHSTTRKWKTEYKSNYKSPTKFSYEDGVWKGAGPPHIQPKDDMYSDNGRHQATAAAPLRRTKSQHDLPNWFAEVMELRQKAQEYQLRARGTHFSRQHTAQLIARQAPMWDASSCTTTASTSSLSAPSVEADRQEGPRNNHPTAGPVSRPNDGRLDNNNNISPVRRKLAWHADEPGNKDSSVGSIPTPEGYKGSVSASSDDFEMIESNGRPPTPRLKEEGIEQRHHLDRTTPAVGGAILTSPKPIRKNPMSHQTPPGRTYVAKSAPARTQAVVDSRGILPGGTDRGFDWPTSTSDDEDDDTLRVDTPPPPLVQNNRIQVVKFQGSPPPAGKPTRDAQPLNDELRSPVFQRHSRNFFETNPAMPVMPRGIDPHPAHTWAGAPRDPDYNRARVGGSIGETSESYSDDDDDDVDVDDDDVVTRRRKESEEEMRQMRTMPVMHGEERRNEPARQRPATMHGEKQGPLARPHSASMYGRPMTAYPQTRQAAGDEALTDNPSNPLPPSRPQNGQLRPTQAWDVPRETNVNFHNGDAISMPRGSVSDRLSMSGISSVSSSSLASEVLDRARKRRDDFWGTP